MLVIDQIDQQLLESWQRECISAAEIQRDIDYFVSARDGYAKDLRRLEKQVAKHYPGFNEAADAQVEKLKHDLEWYDKRISILKWILQQPHEVDVLRAEIERLQARVKELEGKS